MRSRRFLLALALAFLASSCAACSVQVRIPPPAASTTTSTIYCPASATPGPALTDPESPNYDPNWEENYPEVWCP